MRDITHKIITLRTAKAMAVVLCSAETIEMIRANMLPKGNLFDVARAAAFLGAKCTPQLLPHCHPVNIDCMDISFTFLNDDAAGQSLNFAGKNGIVIRAEPKSIGRTGFVM